MALLLSLLLQETPAGKTEFDVRATYKHVDSAGSSGKNSDAIMLLLLCIQEPRTYRMGRRGKLMGQWTRAAWSLAHVDPKSHPVSLPLEQGRRANYADFDSRQGRF